MYKRQQTDILDLTMEAQEVRNVLLEVMAEKGLGKATLKVERVCALLDPWRKSLDDSQNRELLCNPHDPRRGGLEGAHREVMAEKGLGKATLKVERVCALLDP